MIRVDVLMRVVQAVAEFNKRNKTRSCVARLIQGKVEIEMCDFATTEILFTNHEVPIRDLEPIPADLRVNLILSWLAVGLDVQRKAHAA